MVKDHLPGPRSGCGKDFIHRGIILQGQVDDLRSFNGCGRCFKNTGTFSGQLIRL